MLGYQIRLATEADFPEIVDIINAQSPEPMSLEEFQRQEQIRPQEDPFRRLVATTPEGEVAAYGIAAGGPTMREGTFQLRVRTAKAHRYQGLGRELYTMLERWAAEQGARRLESTVLEKDTDEQAWVERRGWVKENHFFESTRSLADFDPSPFWSAVTRAESSGIRFTTLASEMQGEATMRKYYNFLMPVMMQQPGVEGVPVPPFELFTKWITSSPTWDPAGVILAADGDRWVAVSDVQVRPSGAYYNGFTGVQQEYRGRGLALAVKLFSLDYASKKGAPYIRTNNHSTNQPMLAVNRKLGYVPEPGVYQIAKRLVEA